MACGADGRWSYGGNPGANPGDALRFMIGDTASRAPLLLDGEVDYLTQKYGGNVRAAAIEAIESLLARAACGVDETVGAVSIRYSQRLQNLKEILSMLRQKQAMDGGFVPFAGGIYRTDKLSREHDATLVRPKFSMHHRDERVPDERHGYGGYGDDATDLLRRGTD